MSDPSFFAVIPPPPSFDPETYKPFDAEFDRTVSRILSEDASFESKDEDWPSFTGSSNHPTPQKDNNNKKSRFFTKSATVGDKKVRKKPRTVARRDITLIHLDSDAEDDVQLTGLLDMKGVESEEVDLRGEEDSNDQVNSIHISRGDVDRPKDSKSNREEANIWQDNNDPTNLDDASHGDANGFHGSESNRDDIFKIATDKDGDDLVAAEEDIVFASVEPSRRDELLHFVVSHPFMQNREVPVRRSVRRRFVNDLRGEAVSVGMDDAAIDGLIIYVRKLYLEDMGVKGEVTGDVQDLKFGQEIDDEHTERTHRRKSRKRSLSHPEQAEPLKRKRSKASRRISVEDLVPTPQPIPQNQIPTETRESETTSQSPAEVHGHGSLCRDTEVTSVRETPEFVPCPEYPTQAPETAQHESPGDMESSEQQDESANLGVKQFQINGLEPANLSSALGQAPNGKNALTKQQLGHPPPRLPIDNVHDSQPSEPELPPIHELAVRPEKRNKKRTGKKPEEKIASGNTLEQGTARSLVIDMTRDSPSPGPTVPSGFANNKLPAAFKPNKSSYDGRQRHQRKHSADHAVKAAAPQGIRLDALDSGTEPGLEPRWKKEQNYRKKERKKRKKRQSFIGQSESNADQQPVERPHTPVRCQSRTVATTPPSRASNRNSDKSKYGPLSPDPAEWDMDF
jgi:hypothetical protein